MAKKKNSDYHDGAKHTLINASSTRLTTKQNKKTLTESFLGCESIWPAWTIKGKEQGKGRMKRRGGVKKEGKGLVVVQTLYFRQHEHVDKHHKYKTEENAYAFIFNYIDVARRLALHRETSGSEVEAKVSVSALPWMHQLYNHDSLAMALSTLFRDSGQTLSIKLMNASIQLGAVKLVLWHHLMHEIQVHPVMSENQFHCTRLYSALSSQCGTHWYPTKMQQKWLALAR